MLDMITQVWLKKAPIVFKPNSIFAIIVTKKIEGLWSITNHLSCEYVDFIEMTLLRNIYCLRNYGPCLLGT